MSVIRSYLPVTRAGHIVKGIPADLSRVIEHWFQARAQRSYLLHGMSVEKKIWVGRNLQTALNYLDPLATQPTRVLILETWEQDWTVVFSNHMYGWYELGFFLTNELKTTSVFFLLQNHTLRRSKGAGFLGMPGAFQFIMFDCGKTKRLVELVHDGGRWVFSTEGDPLPFEDVKRYEARKKQERFTAELLQEYLGALNFSPFKDEFYRVDAEHPVQCIELIIHHSNLAKNFQFTPLSELRERWGPYEQ
jgi:hypothetical protein